MRDRLIDLLEDTLIEWECYARAITIKEMADHLLANGVIVQAHGHWISQEEAINIDRYDLAYTCSVCGHCDWDATESENFNYCPNCGAKMNGLAERGGK